MRVFPRKASVPMLPNNGFPLFPGLVVKIWWFSSVAYTQMNVREVKAKFSAAEMMLLPPHLAIEYTPLLSPFPLLRPRFLSGIAYACNQTGCDLLQLLGLHLSTASEQSAGPPAKIFFLFTRARV